MRQPRLRAVPAVIVAERSQLAEAWGWVPLKGMVPAERQKARQYIALSKIAFWHVTNIRLERSLRHCQSAKRFAGSKIVVNQACSVQQPCG